MGPNLPAKRGDERERERARPTNMQKDGCLEVDGCRICSKVWPLWNWVSCHFRLWSVVDHAKPCLSMKMEVPGLADSLQQCLCVNSGIYAGDVLDTDPGWQQSKLIWALSAEAGSASRMHRTGL